MVQARPGVQMLKLCSRLYDVLGSIWRIANADLVLLALAVLQSGQWLAACDD